MRRGGFYDEKEYHIVGGPFFNGDRVGDYLLEICGSWYVKQDYMPELPGI